MKHLLLSPETAAIDEAANHHTRLACFKKPRALRHRKHAEILFRPQERGLTSLTILFENIDQNWSFISSLLLPATGEYLAIDNIYCQALMTHSGQDLVSPLVSARPHHLLGKCLLTSAEQICQSRGPHNLQSRHRSNGESALPPAETMRIAFLSLRGTGASRSSSNQHQRKYCHTFNDSSTSKHWHL